MDTQLSFEGEFAIWSYTIGHGRLLLRRTKSSRSPTRVDILLKDVGWVAMPTTFTDIRIQEAAPVDLERFLGTGSMPRASGRTLYALSGRNWRGYVLAGAVISHEDQGEYNDPSHLLE